MCCIASTSQALHFKKYSTASDVWSFGMLMFEIWSLGHKPLEGYTNDEVNLYHSYQELQRHHNVILVYDRLSSLLIVDIVSRRLLVALKGSIS